MSRHAVVLSMARKTAAQLDREINAALAGSGAPRVYPGRMVPIPSKAKALEYDIVSITDQKPKAAVARAGRDTAKRGISNLRYGLYRHSGDREYKWGNFTGTPAHVLVAIEPTDDAVRSQTSLIRALMAQLSDEDRVAIDLVLQGRNGSAEGQLTDLVPDQERRAFIKVFASHVKSLRARAGSE